MHSPGPDWAAYAQVRNLSRNRLLYAHHVEMVEDFLRQFAWMPTDKRILDIGPANGFFPALLRELGFGKLEAVELSPVFLEVLLGKGIQAHPGNIVTGEGLEALSPPYDVVVMMEVLEHLDRPEAALANIRRLMAPDGLLYLTVPVCLCATSWLLRTIRRMSRREQVLRIDETHVQAFSPRTLRELLEAAGFRVEEMRRVSFYFPWWLKSRRRARLFAALRAAMPNCLRGLCLAVAAHPAGEGGS